MWNTDQKPFRKVWSNSTSLCRHPNNLPIKCLIFCWGLIPFWTILVFQFMDGLYGFMLWLSYAKNICYTSFIRSGIQFECLQCFILIDKYFVSILKLNQPMNLIIKLIIIYLPSEKRIFLPRNKDKSNY